MVISALDADGGNLWLLPVYLAFALVGALLLWAPGLSKFMQNRRRA
jgi:hypothetical protein